MTPNEIRQQNRYSIFCGMQTWIAKQEPFNENDKKRLVEEIKNKFKSNDTSYGFASDRDFGDLAVVFSNLFAHNNKQYFVYKAISDSNKVGYLSRRQCYALEMGIKKMEKRGGLSSSSREKWITEFLAEHGTMASPYKLLKRAFKENPRAKFLARCFPLAKDKKTTVNEDILISLCDALMRSKTNITIERADINECYKVNLSDDYRGSGERYTTSSCMYSFNVGKFYEAFGVEGRIVYERGKPIGRFLLWNLPDGKQYVDRLYVQGHGYQDALSEIDRVFPDAYKYPYLRDCRSGEEKQYVIPLKNPELLQNKSDIPYTPYLDTFCYLLRKEGKYFLSNNDYMGNGYQYVYTLHDTGNPKHFYSCEHCKQMYWMGDSAMDAGNKAHLLVCTAYEPRQKKLQEMIAVYRKYMQGGYDVSRDTLFQV